MNSNDISLKLTLFCANKIKKAQLQVTTNYALKITVLPVKKETKCCQQTRKAFLNTAILTYSEIRQYKTSEKDKNHDFFSSSNAIWCLVVDSCKKWKSKFLRTTRPSLTSRCNGNIDEESQNQQIGLFS